MANLYNNSGQAFLTPITEAQDPTVTIDAADFTEAIYRIFASDCTTALVTASLTGGEITLTVKLDNQGVPITVFKTTLSKTQMLDNIVPAGQYTHSFKVTNTDGLELPPVFQNTVTIVRACD